ncbi:ABC transporter substrate-binding protein [Noviherbaspirillum massiliense]|uniref:ABC transporter substrate-binding protein n=1 Tax=Noviherbaspirillum massiliense TaxID=1465823 RepID=UPI0002D42612|nr:ABC transporter substrate-binding protein [Noviherbaspirillum massiliense]
MWMRLGKWVGGSLVMLAMSAGTCLAEVGVTPNSITLGESAAFSGPAAELGIQLHAGAKAYFDMVNEEGGVHGRKISIQTADDKYEPQLAVANTKRFIESGSVFALFGYVGTPTSNAVVPIFSQAKMVFFAPFSGAQSLREPFNRYIFNVRAGYFEETEHLVDQLVKLGINDIAVFYQNDAYGLTGLDGVQRALKKRNLSVVGTATVERNSTDVSSAVAKLLPKRPDAIIQISAYASCAAFIKEMKKGGYTGQFHNVSFVGSQALARALGNDGVGVGVSQVVPFPWRQANPIVNEYTKAMKKAGIDNLNFSSLEGFIAAKVFVEGLRRAGPDLTRDKFIKALETINLSNYDIGFPVNFSASSHNGSTFVDMTAITKNEKFIN